MLFDFINYKNNDCDFNYGDFLNLIKNDSKYQQLFYRFMNCGRKFDDTYKLFDGIFEFLNIYDGECKRLTKTKIDNLKYILVNNALEHLDGDIKDVCIDDFTSDVVERDWYQEISNLIFNSNILDERQKIILRKRFGFESKCHTFSDVASEIDISPERIRQIEAKAIRKLRYSRELKELVKM